MRHLKLFETVNQYQNFKSSDRFKLPNISYCLDDESLAYNPWKETISIKKNCVFNVANGNGLAKSSYTFFNNLSTISSLKINGETVNIKHAHTEHITTTFQDFISQIQFDGEIWVKNDENSEYGYHLNENITYISDDIFTIKNPKWILNNSVNIDKCVVGMYCNPIASEALSGNYGKYGQLVLGELNMYIEEGYFVYDAANNTITCNSDFFYDAFFPGINQDLLHAFGMKVDIIIYDTTNPQQDFQIEYDKTFGDTNYVITEEGEYNTEIEFNSDILPYDLFTNGHKYSTCAISDLGDDFFNDFQNVPNLHGCIQLKSLTIPDHIKGIIGDGEISLHNCDSLETVHLGKGISEVYTYGFSSLDNLSTITTNNPHLYIHEDAFTYSYMQFLKSSTSTIQLGGTLLKYNEGGEDVVINGNTTHYIYTSAFSGNQTITSVTLTDGVKEIMSDAFNRCKNLKEVILPEGLEKIGYDAFGMCSSLKTIVLPNSITSITTHPFSDSSLSSLTLGDSVSYLGWVTFYNCNYLTEIICKSIIAPKLGEDGDRIYVENSTGTVYYPKGSDYSSWIEKFPSGWNFIEQEF